MSNNPVKRAAKPKVAKPKVPELVIKDAVRVGAPDEMLPDILRDYDQASFAAGIYFAVRRMQPHNLSERRHRAVAIEAYDGTMVVMPDGAVIVDPKAEGAK